MNRRFYHGHYQKNDDRFSYSFLVEEETYSTQEEGSCWKSHDHHSDTPHGDCANQEEVSWGSNRGEVP